MPRPALLDLRSDICILGLIIVPSRCRIHLSKVAVFEWKSSKEDSSDMLSFHSSIVDVAHVGAGEEEYVGGCASWAEK